MYESDSHDPDSRDLDAREDGAREAARAPAPDEARVADALSAALAAGYLDADPAGGGRRWALLYDREILDARFEELSAAFPADALHAAAIKANPLPALLSGLVERGAGAEAASMAEVRLALAAGCAPASIVFDSPAKTRAELREALSLGVTLNADNLDEIARIDSIVEAEDLEVRAPIGLRVNPEVGAGDIPETSVATVGSKFGASLSRRRDAIVEAFAAHRWLRGLHVHVGSQGVGLALLLEGARRVAALADQIDRRCGGRRIEVVDIGGGMPVAYRGGERVPTMEEYAAALRDAVPGWFGGEVRLVTEFGRWLHAHAAVAASRVEYVKPSGGSDIAVIHFGADLLLRRAYRPSQWYHRLSVHGPDGAPKGGPKRRYTVAGPLCFSGDLLARDLELPVVEPGDIIVAHDVGGYTFSMWSRYCSRTFPAIVGHRGARELHELHGGESDRDVVSFWGGG